MTKTRVLMSWSSGKDSAWALHQLRQDAAIEVVALLTTFNAEAGRVAMHAVRRELVEAQAERLGLPLWAVDLPWPCPNSEYETRMRAVCERAVGAGIRAVAFGDLFLQSVREYRERQLAGTGLTPLFPLWLEPTDELAGKMLAAGVEATLTCVDRKKLDGSFAGRRYDARLLAELPAGTDPCGENGEFHTFVHASPAFRRPIAVRTGARIERDGFTFADLEADE